MPFAPGQVVLQRYFRRDRYTFVRPMRVVRHDDDGLLLWLTVGSECASLVDADGRTGHDLPLDELREPRLTTAAWRDYDVLMWMPVGAAYSIWWMFSGGAFAGWYVNLESPYQPHAEGVDSTDQVLDIWIEAD